MSFLWALIGFVIIIGVLVTIHEWGHYAVARYFNVKVLQFSIGFGKPIVKKQWGETQYQIGLIPLGGYVKFLDERVEPVSGEERERAFNRQSVYKRFAIVMAGPAINLFFAWLLFALVSMIGVVTPKPIFSQPAESTPLAAALASEPIEDIAVVTRANGQAVKGWQDVQQAVLQGLVHSQEDFNLGFSDLGGQGYREVRVPLTSLDINDLNTSWLSALGFEPFQPRLQAYIGDVVAGSPAEQLGLQSGDLIVAVDDRFIADWSELIAYVQPRAGELIVIDYERDGVRFRDSVRLDAFEHNGERQGRLGIGVDASQVALSDYFQTTRLGPIDALVYGYNRSVDFTAMTLAMLKRMLLGQVSIEHLSGPISIANFSGQALQSGLVTFLGLMALLSLSLGILNLLPIPMLDGGHLVYYLIEMVRGKPVSEQVQEVGFRIGLLIIVGLTLLAISSDIVRLTNG